jgi:pyrroloquinoline quinone biosynthesis protein D
MSNPGGHLPAHSESRWPELPVPTDSSQPRLAKGVRWGAATAEEATVLFPEGAIKLHGTSKAILEHCNGERTFSQVIDELLALYPGAPATLVRDEAGQFLESLQKKRIVDY